MGAEIVMRTLSCFTLLVILAATSALFGCALEHPRALKEAQANAAKPIAIIAFTQCHSLLGIVIVTQDGTVQGLPDASLEQAQAIADALPKKSRLMAAAPCSDLTT